MKIIVCIKQVPDTTEVKLDPKTGRLIRDGVPSIINPDDKKLSASRMRTPTQRSPLFRWVPLRLMLQCAKRLQWVPMKRSSSAAGSSAVPILGQPATLLQPQSKRFPITTSSSAAGRQSKRPVGPQIAEQLNIPQITYVQKLDIEGDKVIVQRQLEDGYTVVEAKMPVLLTAIKELNTPRYMTPKGIFEAYNKTVQVWGFNDVPVDAEKIGLKGSPTNVNRTFSPEAKGKGIMLEGADKETVKTLIAKLDEKHLL